MHRSNSEQYKNPTDFFQACAQVKLSTKKIQACAQVKLKHFLHEWLDGWLWRNVFSELEGAFVGAQTFRWHYWRFNGCALCVHLCVHKFLDDIMGGSTGVHCMCKNFYRWDYGRFNWVYIVCPFVGSLTFRWHYVRFNRVIHGRLLYYYLLWTYDEPPIPGDSLGWVWWGAFWWYVTPSISECVHINQQLSLNLLSPNYRHVFHTANQPKTTRHQETPTMNTEELSTAILKPS